MAVGDQVLGVIIELIGTTLSVVGLNGQKHALMRAEIMRNTENVWQNWRWAVAFAVFFLGQGTELIVRARTSVRLFVRSFVDSSRTHTR